MAAGWTCSSSWLPQYNTIGFLWYHILTNLIYCLLMWRKTFQHNLWKQTQNEKLVQKRTQHSTKENDLLNEILSTKEPISPGHLILWISLQLYSAKRSQIPISSWSTSSRGILCKKNEVLKMRTKTKQGLSGILKLPVNPHKSSTTLIQIEILMYMTSDSQTMSTKYIIFSPTKNKCVMDIEKQKAKNSEISQLAVLQFQRMIIQQNFINKYWMWRSPK